MSDQTNFLLLRIQALELENIRLNNEIRKVKDVAFKAQLSDPNFDKPLSELNVNYEIITP